MKINWKKNFAICYCFDSFSDLLLLANYLLFSDCFFKYKKYILLNGKKLFSFMHGTYMAFLLYFTFFIYAGRFFFEFFSLLRWYWSIYYRNKFTFSNRFCSFFCFTKIKYAEKNLLKERKNNQIINGIYGGSKIWVTFKVVWTWTMKKGNKFRHVMSIWRILCGMQSICFGIRVWEIQVIFE